MTWRRAAATWLLVFCLAVSAISPLASPSSAADRAAAQPPLGVAAPDGALACVFGSKVENAPHPESQPAIAGLANCLGLFRGAGGLLRDSNDGTLPTSVSVAVDIRGPPQSTHS